jgi:predicted transport protein
MEFERQLEKRCRPIERRVLKQYIAYRANGNFATVVQRQKHLLVYLHLHPDAACLPPGLGRSVLGRAHLGTGDVEVTVRTPADLEGAMPFVEAAWRAALLRAES